MTTRTNTEINNTAATANYAISFKHFLEALAVDEGNRRTGISFMADLYSFFFWEQVIIAKEMLDQGYTTEFANKHLVSLCEKPEYMRSRMHYHGLKAIRTLTALNSHYREKTGKRFILVKLSKEDGLYNFSEIKKLFQDFEDQYNLYHNPENIEGRNFADTNWYYIQ